MDEFKSGNIKYKGREISEIVITSLDAFFQKIKAQGIKNSLKTLLPGMDLDKFVLIKTQKQLAKRRGIELGRGLGRFDIQYRSGGIQIEPVGFLKLLIKKITISDAQIHKSFNIILDQIEKKYIHDKSYITEKIDDIIFNLAETEIYKPKTSEEKTLYDMAALILLNYYKSAKSVPEWIEPALENIGKGEFIGKWIEMFTGYISEVISQVSENVFIDYKVTFDSLLVRSFLNKKTNKGQISQLLALFNINIKDLVSGFVQRYVSPSFIKGSSEILLNVASSFLSDVNKSLGGDAAELSEGISKEPFNITVTLGENVFTGRSFRWYTKESVTRSAIEYSYDPSFAASFKVPARRRRVNKTYPILNLGLVASYKAVPLSEYSADLTDLPPGRMFYRILWDENECGETNTLELRKPSDEFKFAVFADSQGMVKRDYEIFAKLLTASVKDESRPNFIVHLGDFVDDGNNEEYWKWVLEPSVWRENAAVPLSGNHEARISAAAFNAGVGNSIVEHFNIRSAPPQDLSLGIYYSFVYNNATFIVLNTNNAASDKGLDKNQYKWAMQVLKSAKTPWKIIFTHKAPYSNGPHYKDLDVKIISKQIVDLAYEGDADLVIGGHDHVYARTPVLAQGMPLNSKYSQIDYKGEVYKTAINPRGTVFVIPGTSGVKNYTQYFPVNFPAEVLMDLNQPVYSEVEIKDNLLCFCAYLFDINKNEFKKIDSFALQKQEVKKEQIDSRCVSEMINSIPDSPWMDHSYRIDKAVSLYNSLDYSEKIIVPNYEKLLRACDFNRSYKNIVNSGIKTVKNKHEFMDAVNNPSVGTIIVKCEEIKFENQFALGSKVLINRDLCIRGSARLLYVRFILKPKVMLMISGSICLDNTRKIFSVYPAKDIIEMHDNSIFILNDDATLSGGYGTGLKGRGINIAGRNCTVYLNSSGQSYVNKGMIFDPFECSGITVNSGKYLASGGNYTFNVNGKLKIRSGFIRSIYGHRDAQITIDGGTVGECDKLNFPIPVECRGNLFINSGTIKSRDGISVFMQKGGVCRVNSESKNANLVDIKGKILYN